MKPLAEEFIVLDQGVVHRGQERDGTGARDREELALGSECVRPFGPGDPLESSPEHGRGKKRLAADASRGQSGSVSAGRQRASARETGHVPARKWCVTFHSAAVLHGSEGDTSLAAQTGCAPRWAGRPRPVMARAFCGRR